MNNHKCVKCNTSYTDDDFDDYYCPPCNEHRKIIAAEIDKKIRNTVSKRQIKTDLQLYNEIQRETGARFIPASALGIK